ELHGMRLIVEIDLNPVEGHTMTEKKLKPLCPRLEALVAQDRDLLKALVKEVEDILYGLKCLFSYESYFPNAKNASEYVPAPQTFGARADQWLATLKVEHSTRIGYQRERKTR